MPLSTHVAKKNPNQTTSVKVYKIKELLLVVLLRLSHHHLIETEGAFWIENPEKELNLNNLSALQTTGFIAAGCR